MNTSEQLHAISKFMMLLDKLNIDYLKFFLLETGNHHGHDNHAIIIPKNKEANEILLDHYEDINKEFKDYKLIFQNSKMLITKDGN
jgi:hypothetical protein